MTAIIIDARSRFEERRKQVRSTSERRKLFDEFRRSVAQPDTGLGAVSWDDIA